MNSGKFIIFPQNFSKISCPKGQRNGKGLSGMGFTHRTLRKFKDFLIDGSGGLVRFRSEPLPQNSAAVLINLGDLRRFSTVWRVLP